jgi:hypothetical protein
MNKELLYFIMDDSDNTYDIDPNGKLITTPSPRPLENTPDGWQEAAIQYGRNTTYFGIVRSFTVPLGFVKKGARIVRKLYYSKGVQAIARLLIAKYDKFKLIYTRVYKSALNFSTFNDSETTATIQTTDDDLTMYIKANESTTYEIPIDVPEAINVLMDGMDLYSTVRAINYAWLITEDDGTQVADLFTSDYIFMGFSITSTETQYPSVLWATTTSYKGANSLDYDPADWLMQATVDVAVKIQSQLTVFTVGADALRIGAYIRSGQNVAREEDIFPPTAPGPTGLLTFDLDYTLNLRAGDRVWLFINQIGSGAGKELGFPQDNIVNFPYQYRKEPTSIKCLRGLYVLDQLVKKMSNNNYGAESVLLSEGGEAYDFVLTSGDAIRGFTADPDTGYAGPSIKTSLSDFFKSYNTRFNTAITNTAQALVFQEKTDVFTQSNITDIGEVQDLQIAPLTDHIFSSITIGWPNQTYDDPNGKEEFNTTHVYTTPVTRVSKTLDLTSVYRADAYGIEFTRINLDGKTTTDSSSDNDVFIINIAETPEGSFILNRPAFDSITGLLAGDTAFNVLLSPKRCLIKHGCYLRVGLDKLEDQYLVYQTQDKNPSLVTVQNGVTITENGDYLISALDSPLFLPQMFQYNCQTPYNIVDLIEADPNGIISFSWKGAKFLGGYVYAAGQQPANNAQQAFQLYAAVGNDMEALIDLNND